MARFLWNPTEKKLPLMYNSVWFWNVILWQWVINQSTTTGNVNSIYLSYCIFWSVWGPYSIWFHMKSKAVCEPEIPYKCIKVFFVSESIYRKRIVVYSIGFHITLEALLLGENIYVMNQCTLYSGILSTYSCVTWNRRNSVCLYTHGSAVCMAP